MSLQLEAIQTEPVPPPATVGRMYRQYVMEDLVSHETPSAGVANNLFFVTSMQLTQLWKRAPKNGNTPYDAEAQADLMAEAYDRLPIERPYDRYLADVLRTGHLLVDGRDEAPSPELQVDIQDLFLNRALELRNVLASPHLSEKRKRFAQQLFAGACASSALNVENLAMPPTAHQIVDNHSNTHDGILLERDYRLLNPFRRFSVAYHCAGFAEGHPDTAQAATLATRFKRVRVLSACCDLKLLSNDGRTELPDIIDILKDCRDGTASSGDIAYISQISKNLATTLTTDESRKGTRLTGQQMKRLYFKEKAALLEQ